MTTPTASIVEIFFFSAHQVLPLLIASDALYFSRDEDYSVSNDDRFR